MTAIIRVALDVPLPRLFDYLSEDAKDHDIGARVVVSFGRRRMVGIVVEIATTSDLPLEKLKPCEKILRDIAPLPRPHRFGEILQRLLPGADRRSAYGGVAATAASP